MNECVGSDDAPDIAEPNLPRGTDCAAMVPAEIHVEPADDDGHSRIGAHSNQEETCVLDVLVVVDCEHYCEARDRYGNRDECEDETVLCEIRACGYDHCECEGAGPRRHTVQLRLNRGVAVRLDDCWGEEGVAVGRHDHTEVHESSDDDFVVFEDTAYVTDGDLAFCGGAALVCLEAGFHVGAFLRGEPFGILGERGDEEKEYEGDHAG